MTALRPFFMLVGRASVFWLGAVTLFTVSMIVAGVLAPESRLGLYVDGLFVAAFAFPASAGWLAGAVIQEFQHTTIANLLPGVRSRIAAGFLTTGLGIALLVVGVIATTGSPRPAFPVLFVIALAGYCLGGVLFDPRSARLTVLHMIVALSAIVVSRDLAGIVTAHPWPSVVIAVAIAAFAIFRLFSRTTFRRKPFLATSPFPGAFSLDWEPIRGAGSALHPTRSTARWAGGACPGSARPGASASSSWVTPGSTRARWVSERRWRSRSTTA
jgi:hypothetical protein